MTGMIRAPWTPEQVAALNEFQQRGGMHPFTCGHDHPAHPDAVLKATPKGWRCYVLDCEYEQDWAHAFMANPAAWPAPCSCGGRFPIHHLHADVHEPAEQPARTTPDNPAASSDSADNASGERSDVGTEFIHRLDHPDEQALAAFEAELAEQPAPVDWQDVAKRRERELKKAGQARHRAEQQRDQLAALARDILYSSHYDSSQFTTWRETLDQIDDQGAPAVVDLPDPQ